MANIAPIVRTQVTNPTKNPIKYNWYPPHGLWVDAKSTVTVDLEVMTAATLTHKQSLQCDLDEKRVKLKYDILRRSGVSVLGEEKDEKVHRKPTVKPTPKEVEKPEVKKAQEEAERNEKAKEEKLEKIETGEEPVEPFSETFQDKTIEEMKPPIQPMFDEEWAEKGTKKADVETVDMFGTEAFGDKAEAAAEKAAADKAAKKAASIAKGLATRKANKAKKEAAAKEAAATKSETTNFGNIDA